VSCPASEAVSRRPSSDSRLGRAFVRRLAFIFVSSGVALRGLRNSPCHEQPPPRPLRDEYGVLSGLSRSSTYLMTCAGEGVVDFAS
jgi:hypothetical protein